MTALAAPKKTPNLGSEGVVPRVHDLSVKASSSIYAGALVVMNAGYAAKATTATGLIAAGVAQETVDNSSGSNGDKKVRVHTGTFKFKNSSSTDQIGVTEIGKDVYIVDDQTVAKTDGSSSRSRAGKVMAIDADGDVWVLVGLGL